MSINKERESHAVVPSGNGIPLTDAAMKLEAAQRLANSSFPWDEFDPFEYADNNYRELRDDDLRILDLVRDYFASFYKSEKALISGIDVGSGANLYPALSMLPFCHSIRMLERGKANVEWLNGETKHYSPMWDQYWDVLETVNAYRAIEDPRTTLFQRAQVLMGDLFRQPTRRWDVGTMFFVAESISQQEREFNRAVQMFMNCLKPGSPFAAAFMEDSSGYDVGPHRFPAVAVTIHDVRHSLSQFSDDVDVQPIPSVRKRRDGYHGMILALGTVRKKQR